MISARLRRGPLNSSECCQKVWLGTPSEAIVSEPIFGKGMRQSTFLEDHKPP